MLTENILHPLLQLVQINDFSAGEKPLKLIGYSVQNLKREIFIQFFFIFSDSEIGNMPNLAQMFSAMCCFP